MVLRSNPATSKFYIATPFICVEFMSLSEEPSEVFSDDSISTSDDEYSLSSWSSDDFASREENDPVLQEHPPYHFIQEPSPDIFCPVTLDVMLVPCQTLCCGNHVSFYAARRLKRTKKRCPICKKLPLRFIEDKYFQRVVLGTRIYCSKKESGCPWVGELRELQGHLSEDKKGRCGYVDVACPFDCGKSIMRHSLEDHKKNNCSKRPFSCSYCACAGTYDTITGDHWPECKKFPLQCPNQCSSTNIQRQLLKRHLSEDCPQQEIECEFSYAGCTSHVKRCKLNEHIEEEIEHHLRSLARYTQKLHMHTTSFLSLSHDIHFYNFKRYFKTNCEWYIQSIILHTHWWI